MKQMNTILAFVLLVPNGALFSQTVSITPKTPAQKWFIRATNNFTRLPRWFTIEWLQKVPKSSWQKVKHLFAGFEFMTIIGLIKNENRCVDIRHFKYYGDEIVKSEKEIEQLDELYDLFRKTPEGTYQRTQAGSLIFKNKKQAKAAVRKVSAWLIPPNKKDLFIGDFDPQLLFNIITEKYRAHEAKIKRMQADRAYLQQRYPHVKKYAQTGISDCKDIGIAKFVGIMIRDIVFITLVIVAAILGIIFAPEIYDAINQKLFTMQVSQQPVPDDVPHPMKAAENMRQQIISRSFLLPSMFDRGANVPRALTHNKINEDSILYYAELYPNIASYFKNNLLALYTKIPGITPIGLIASTPYIKDRNRMGYIRRLLQADVVPTETDKQLVNLLTWKLKRAYRPQMKGMREFRKLGAQGSAVPAILPQSIMSEIQQRVYPAYMQMPFVKE